jgi:hypothetical protein
MQAHDAEKIGPVRSTRDYFVDFALDYDAIFIHHGGSTTGYERLRQTGIDRFDGMQFEGICFWRDRSYPDWWSIHGNDRRSLEHSSFTGSGPIRDAIESRGLRDSLYEDSHFGFSFGLDDTPEFLRAGIAKNIRVPFSGNYTRRFEYDEETKLYTVLNRLGPYVDAETQEEIEVRNIIIQLVNSRVIPGDSEGRRNVQTVGEGGGFLIANGFHHRISWKKTAHNEPTRWYFLNGSEMNLAPGRTWICVFQDNATVQLEVEEDE